MTESIIITAGGIGIRMGLDMPKQFIEIKGVPILMHTINRFYCYNSELQIILVLPQAHIEFWNTLIKKHNFKVEHQIVQGGNERFHSIKNGLAVATGQIIGVHDGVRPFVSIEVIKNTFKSTPKHKAVIPVINVNESLRQIDNKNSKAVKRSDYRTVQTPQCFTAELIKKAYEQAYCDSFTDDASVVECLGQKIYLIKGNNENIKITTPIDLKLAEVLLN